MLHQHEEQANGGNEGTGNGVDDHDGEDEEVAGEVAHVAEAEGKRFLTGSVELCFILWVNEAVEDVVAEVAQSKQIVGQIKEGVDKDELEEEDRVLRGKEAFVQLDHLCGLVYVPIGY